MIRNDLDALDQFDEQLTEKLQFLLDAILGMISVNQNNVMKLFTVVSVVAVPPVLLAGIWGMNFKAMPELSRPWGYAMALGAIALSVLIPLGIFKWRGQTGRSGTARHKSLESFGVAVQDGANDCTARADRRKVGAGIERNGPVS